MNHTKLELVILSLVIKIFYNFNINSFNFNVEVGGQTIISKSLTLRTLVTFFDISIPDPWSSFSVASYNKLTGIFTTTTKKRAVGRRTRNRA